MKRKWVAILIGVGINSCLATTVYAEQEELTERIPALEFSELYTKRIMEFNSKYGQNMGGLDTGSAYAAFDDGDTYGASCSGGYLTISKEDLTIESMVTSIIDVESEGQEGHNVVLKALIAISALEMNDLAAEGLEMMHDIDPSQPEDVFMKYMEEYDNIIHPALSSNVSKLEAGEEILVYQGNYDYYANYADYEESGKVIYLHAHERK